MPHDGLPKGAPGVTVSLLVDAQEPEWDAFVRATPAGTFCHLSGWRRVIESAFGHHAYYLVARRGAAVSGVLPLTHVRSRLFGNSLVSTAFCVYGGPLTADEDTRLALEARAVAIGEEVRAEYVELRSQSHNNLGWQEKRNLYATFRKPIVADVHANLKAIPRKQRAMIRKAIAAGLRSEIDADVGRLHRVYSESVRNLGTPVFPKSFFRELKKEFGDACDIVTVLHGKVPIASVMNFYFRDEVLPYYGGGTAGARTVGGNDFMYWEVMRRACERGFRVFDFGRSKVGTGAYDFKRYWGFEPTPLAYSYRAR